MLDDCADCSAGPSRGLGRGSWPRWSRVDPRYPLYEAAIRAVRVLRNELAGEASSLRHFAEVDE